MDYKNLILKNKSVRDFETTPVKAELAEILLNFSKECKGLIENIETEVFILDHEAYYRLENVAGYRGYMIEAPNYLVILTEKKEHCIENAGYLGQNFILKALELGLDSCWVTFSDGSQVAQRLGFSGEKQAVALIALGYGKEGQKETVINHTKAGGNSSKAEVSLKEDKESFRMSVEEIVFLQNWDKTASAEELENRGLLEAFYFARLAPSAWNRQPWRFLVKDGRVELAVKKDDFSSSYEGRIAAGIIMLYFEAILGITLFETKWQLQQDNEAAVPQNYRFVGCCRI